MAFACVGNWDVIHAFDHRPNVILPWFFIKFRLKTLLRKKNALFVSDWCDWWTAGGITTSRRPFAFIDRFEQWIEEGSKKNSDGVPVIGSVHYARGLVLSIEENNLMLIPSGVTIEKFPQLKKYDCRKQLNLPQDVPLLGFIGFSLWDMQILAGYRGDGEVFSAVLMQNAETPGLGKEAENPSYMEMFIGHGGEGDVPTSTSELESAEADAVSGATLTFLGIARALEAGSDYVASGGISP
jgi:hypothetical protein